MLKQLKNNNLKSKANFAICFTLFVVAIKNKPNTPKNESIIRLIKNLKLAKDQALSKTSKAKAKVSEAKTKAKTVKTNVKNKINNNILVDHQIKQIKIIFSPYL